MIRAQKAQELLSNDLLQHAVEAETQSIVEQMRRVSLADSEAHTRLVMALQISGAVNRHLWALIQDGHEAAGDLDVRGSRID